MIMENFTSIMVFVKTHLLFLFMDTKSSSHYHREKMTWQSLGRLLLPL
jgi:hypothetical protein